MNKSILIKIIFELKRYWFYFLFSIIFSVTYVVGSLLIPILIGRAIDVIVDINQVDFEMLKKIFAYMAIILVCVGISQYLLNLCNNRLAYHLSYTLREKTFNKLQKLPLSYLDAHPKGDILSRMINDIETLTDGILLGFNQIFIGVMTIIITLVFMFMLNYIMALVVIFLTPISLFVSRFIAKKIHHYFVDQARLKGVQTAFVEEMIQGQKVIRAFQYENNASNEFKNISDELEVVTKKALFFSSLPNPVTRFVNAIVYAVIIFIGAMIVIDNPLFTIGLLTTFLSYASQYTKPFNDISSVVTELQNSFSCGERIYELLAEKEEIEIKRQVLENVDGNIDINNVDFSYDKKTSLIKDFSLKVEKGQKVAIVGPTGCGKTTFINLLMRFYDVDKGTIVVDGVDISNITRQNLRKNYGMVLQDTWLRYGSIKDNITLGEDYSLEDVKKACALSKANNFIELLDDDYNTLIDENGGNLSQGQKQLLCIARVMLRLPPILILDEATSSIDTRTEIKIQEAFNNLMKGKTSFIVAHRLSTIKNADLILVMKDGKIIEQGKHEELLAKNGFYSMLFNSQYQ